MNANGKVMQHRYPHCVIREFVVWEKGRVVYVLDSYPTAIVADNALRVHLYVPNNNKLLFWLCVLGQESQCWQTDKILECVNIA